MLLFLNKLLPIFVLPLGWVVTLLLYAIIRKRRWPVIVALSVLYVCSMPAVGNSLLGWLESAYPPLPLASVEQADAIVPLGGIFGPDAPDGTLANIGEASERLEAGIELWQHKRAPWLVFTGGRLPWEPMGEIEGVTSAKAAVARGVPAEHILVTSQVGNTSDEAHAVAKLMRERGWKKIILVTSGWHLRRAARQFRKAGVDFVPFPVDFQIDKQVPFTPLDFLPRAEGLRNTETTLRELYGIAFYWMFGR